jgi:hypothetical protein
MYLRMTPYPGITVKERAKRIGIRQHVAAHRDMNDGSGEDNSAQER